MAAGGLIGLASRWATAPVLAVLAVVSLMLVLRAGRRPRWADFITAALLAITGVGALLLHNQMRYGSCFETGYQLTYAHMGETMFVTEGYGNRLAALLVSPYRGLLVYSPLVLLALPGLRASRRGPPRLLACGGVAALAAAALFFAAFRYWTGGHSWGPRFLVAPLVLLAPALATAFARRWTAVLVPLAATTQLLSVVLPGSTEEYARFLLDRERPGHCSEWRVECSPLGQRVPRAMAAIANTVADRPGIVVEGRPLVAPEVVLGTSDYRTLYWWPVRIAYRLRLFPAWLGLILCGGGLALGTLCLGQAWWRARRKTAVAL
jgi:hypothetical protein